MASVIQHGARCSAEDTVQHARRIESHDTIQTIERVEVDLAANKKRKGAIEA